MIKVHTAGLVIFILCAMGLAQGVSIERACIKDFKVKTQDIQDFKFGIVHAADIPENLQCAIKCILEKEEWIDVATGEFSPEKLKTHLKDVVTPESVLNIIEVCMKYRVVKTCEDAAKLIECLWSITA